MVFENYFPNLKQEDKIALIKQSDVLKIPVSISVALRQSQVFTDHRDPGRVEYSVKQLIAKRIYSLALGYENFNDHDDLRIDPLLAVLAGKVDPSLEGL